MLHQRNGLLIFPLSESPLCCFVAHLFNDHLTIGTVCLYPSHLWFFQIVQGGPDPSVSMIPQLYCIIHGFSRLQPRCSRPSWLAITIDILDTLFRSGQPRHLPLNISHSRQHALLASLSCKRFLLRPRASDSAILYEYVAHHACVLINVITWRNGGTVWFSINHG